MQRRVRSYIRVQSPISISYARPHAPYGRTIGTSLILVFIFLGILLLGFWFV